MLCHRFRLYSGGTGADGVRRSVLSVPAARHRVRLKQSDSVARLNRCHPPPGLRVTPSVYTTLDEVDRFSAAVEEAMVKGIA